MRGRQSELPQPGIKACRAIPHCPGHNGESPWQGTLQQWATALFCCLPIFPLAGSLSAPTLEGIWPSVMVSPNHGENKGRSCHCKAPFPSRYCGGAHQNHTVPDGDMLWQPQTSCKKQSRRQGQSSLVLFVFLSHLENWSVAEATQGLNIEG